jgi:hypothetical protein
VDVLAIVILLLLHPVLYRLDMMRGIYLPDAIAYIDFAERFLSEGLLYLERGMAGKGNVLPPLYPFFILLAQPFVGDFVVASVFVSSIATLAASVVFYLIIRKFADPYAAFLGTLVIQVNYDLNLWALTPLTEATFIMIVAFLLWFMLYVLGSNRTIFAVVVGVLLAFTFFARQIGLVLLPFVLLVIVLADPRRFAINATSVVLGLVLILAPYVFEVEKQGNRIQAELSAFEPQWSKRDVILFDDVDPNVQDYLRNLQDTTKDEYGDVYVKRRLLRQLLPDSSAMLSEVKITPDGQNKYAISEGLNRIWSSRNQISGNFVKNIQHVITSLGPFVCSIFLVALMTPLWVGGNKKLLLARYLVGGFVLYYLIVLSLFTGLVERYAQILAPFILLHIIIEVANALRMVQRKIRGVPIAPLLFFISLVGCAYSQPSNYSDVESYSQKEFLEFSRSNLRQFVTPGDPVLSTIPFHAYSVGGAWRILPNDSLEKIAIYAARENIPWLLVVHDPTNAVITQRLTRQWYLDADMLLKHGDLIQLRAMSTDGKSMLFRFR